MFEKEIYSFLKINQITFEKNTSLSIFRTHFLPEYNLYLHLISLQQFQEADLNVHYFQNLSEQQNAQGFRIIHLWEDVWMNNKDLVQARILAMIGIFKRLNARHCFIERIDMPITERFLNKNHLQGYVKAKFKYGLFLKEQYVEQYSGFSEFDQILGLGRFNPPSRFDKNQGYKSINLIAVATFSGGRLMKYGDRAGQRSYELLRFASLRGYSVMGGMDKLLKTFEKEHNPNDIMSYADRDWSDGKSYKILGFERIETTEPQTFILDSQTFKRYSVKENIEKPINIFNAGSIKFIKKLS